MTLEEFYSSIGGDYEMALAMFRSEENVYRYIQMYLEDDGYQRLCRAVEAGNTKDAFAAVHTMKGVIGMLHFTRLYNVVVQLVEQLRSQDAPVDMKLFNKVSEEQELVISSISQIRM